MSANPLNAARGSDPASMASDWLGRYGLVLARLVIGLLWVTQLAWKMPPTFGCAPDFSISGGDAARTTGLCGWTGLMAAYSILPLHAAFVKNIIIPNISWLGWFIWLMEFFIAATLILGVVTRLGALVGIVQALNLFIGLGYAPGEWYWTYLMLITLHVIFFCIPPGRVLGIDAYLRRRLAAGAGPKPLALRLLYWLT